MDNTALFFQIHNLSRQSPLLDSLMIFGAEYLIFVTFFLVLLLFFKGEKTDKKTLLLLIFAIPISLTLVKIIRLFFYEPRPFVTFPISPLVDHQATAAFPSLHTTVMATIAFAYYFSKSKYTLIFMILMLWVGIARIFIGVHYPLDILGGIFVGFISVFLTRQIKKRLASKGEPLRA